MHFLLDHDWMHEMGETLPTFRVPLDMSRLFAEPQIGDGDGASVTVRYLTPHSKWSIHSEYQDNLLMLSLSRGGPVVWMSPAGRRRDRRSATTTGSRPVNRNGVHGRARDRQPPDARAAPCSSTTPRSAW